MTQLTTLPKNELSSSRSIHNLLSPRKRNLGCSILIAAVEDYQGVDDQAHGSAAKFLFPTDHAHQEHYDWVVAMADGLDERWLRETLDRLRPDWDRERQKQQRVAAVERRAAHRFSA